MATARRREHHLKGKKSFNSASVTVHCDNLGTVALVNSGYSKVPQSMHLLRCLFFIRAQFQIQLWAVHIPGIENTLADAISRNNLCLLYSQIPEAIGRQSPIPPQLISLLLDPHLDWSTGLNSSAAVFSRFSSYYQKELSIGNKTVSRILPMIWSIISLPSVGSQSLTLRSIPVPGKTIRSNS